METIENLAGKIAWVAIVIGIMLALNWLVHRLPSVLYDQFRQDVIYAPADDGGSEISGRLEGHGRHSPNVPARITLCRAGELDPCDALDVILAVPARTCALAAQQAIAVGYPGYRMAAVTCDYTTATCRDGTATASNSETACRAHGGVREWN